MKHTPEPTISVVIPTCDRPEYLSEAVGSVIRQVSPPQEILIIDNGRVPVDETMLPQNGSLQVVRALPRFGVSQARNLGVILAGGELVSFLDDDDSWDAHYLSGVRETRIQTGADIILGRLRIHDSQKTMSGKCANFGDESDLIRQILLRNPGVVGSNTTVSRERFKTTHGFDPAITTGQDKALVLDLLVVGADIAQAPNSWVNFRDNVVGPRQTEVRKRAHGKWRFLRKYWRFMNWYQRLYNLANWLRIVLSGISGRSR